MWNNVVDRHGHLQGKDGVALFKQALRDQHGVSTKIEMLDENLRPIEDGDIFSKDVENDLTDFITDGNIDVDVTRGTRRTAELTILNPSAEFTPATQDFSSEGDWVGKVYLNRNVRIYRGVVYQRRTLYAPCGTFMIDGVDVMVEQNMSQVTLTMSDRWKMLTKSFASHKIPYDKGTTYNYIIKDMLDAAGITDSFRTIHSLNQRNTADTKITRNYSIDTGESRGDILLKWCKRWHIEIYFNPMGRLITEDRSKDSHYDSSKDRHGGPMWDYYWSSGGDGMIVNLTHSFSDDNLYNHVVVIGQLETVTGTHKTTKPFRVEKSNTNPDSKFRIARMGDRVLLIQDDSIGSDTEARRALNKAWKLRTSLSENIQMSVINNPLLEGNDIIRITERNLAKIDDTYRLQRFNIPLVTSLQTLQVEQILRSDDL